jgi:hypothetical protein
MMILDEKNLQVMLSLSEIVSNISVVECNSSIDSCIGGGSGGGSLLGNCHVSSLVTRIHGNCHLSFTLATGSTFRFFI